MSVESAQLTSPMSPGWLRRRARLARHRLTPSTIVGGVVVLVVAAAALYPILRVVFGLFVVDGRLTVDPIAKALDEPDLATVLRNTVVLVAASSAMALSIGALLAWLNERTDARIGALTDNMPVIPLLLPAIASAIGWVFLLSPRAGYANWAIRAVLSPIGIDLQEGPFTPYSWYTLAFVYAVHMVPFAFLMVTAGLRNSDPSLEEQSQVCGAGLIKTLRSVTIPAIRPSLGAAMFLMIWLGFSLFSIPFVLAGTQREVLSVRIVRLLAYTYPPKLSEAIGLSGFVVLLLGSIWYFQRGILRSGRFAKLGGKARRGNVIKLGRWRGVARACMLSYLFVAVLLPIGALALVVLNGYWTTSIAWSDLSLSRITDVVANDVVIQRALRHSLSLALAGATIGMFLAAVVALWVLHTPGRLAKGLDAAIKLPAAVSGLVLAVGFILAYSGSPFNLAGTLAILLLAYVVISMPLASVTADTAAAQVGEELAEASSIAGAPFRKTFLRIYIPLMIPGLAMGWTLLFVRMFGDLETSALLSRTANNVIGPQILSAFEFSSYNEPAALALVLTTISILVIGTVLLLSRAWARWTRVAS